MGLLEVYLDPGRTESAFNLIAPGWQPDPAREARLAIADVTSSR